MDDDDWSFAANLARGHLPTGESLEALYGHGWWSEEQYRQPVCPPVVQCHVCGGHAYDLGHEIDCEKCGVISNTQISQTSHPNDPQSMGIDSVEIPVAEGSRED